MGKTKFIPPGQQQSAVTVPGNNSPPSLSRATTVRRHCPGTDRATTVRSHCPGQQQSAGTVPVLTGQQQSAGTVPGNNSPQSLSRYRPGKQEQNTVNCFLPLLSAANDAHSKIISQHCLSFLSSVAVAFLRSLDSLHRALLD